LRRRGNADGPCVLCARDRAVGFSERHATGEVGEFFGLDCRDRLHPVLSVFHLPCQPSDQRSKLRDLFERMSFGLFGFQSRPRFVRAISQRRLQIG
jgi:hypothetical protein